MADVDINEPRKHGANDLLEASHIESQIPSSNGKAFLTWLIWLSGIALNISIIGMAVLAGFNKEVPMGLSITSVSLVGLFIAILVTQRA